MNYARNRLEVTFVKRLGLALSLNYFVYLAFLSVTPVPARSYTTSFPLTETPLSEGGNWINGGTVGLDWTNCATMDHRVVGFDYYIGYGDATALLTGPWGPTQYVAATIYATNIDNYYFQESELRLRSSLSAHSCTGYECNFSMHTSSPYFEIVRWNGAIGDFTYIVQTTLPNGLKTGDVIAASITNSTIRMFVNGVQVAMGTDSTWTNGSPGIGFYSEPLVGNYGLSSFTATDGIASPAARFVAGPVSGSAPLRVTFTNLSTGATNYLWAFGDGNTSTDANPVNTFTNPGAYSISLTALGAGGSDTLTLSNGIVVVAPLPVILSPLVANGQFGFSFLTAVSQSYTIEQNLNFATTNWIAVSNLLGTGSACQFSVPMTNAQLGTFFRIRQP